MFAISVRVRPCSSRSGPRSVGRVTAIVPSSCAICTFSLELGISAFSCSALLALRMRVSMSATGSVSISLLLPGALRHAGDDALVGELPQADPAEPELAEHGARAPATVAAGVVAHLELRGARGLRDHGLLGHLVPSLLGRERHAEAPQKGLRLL